MTDRTKLLNALAISGLTLALPACQAARAAGERGTTQPTGMTHHQSERHAGAGDEEHEGERGQNGGRDHPEQHEHEGDNQDREESEESGRKHWVGQEIEQAVPMNAVPQAVVDAVKKEVPSGTITEAELEVKKGKIVYGFDVKDGDMTYDINISVDGKFMSKVVDDAADADEKPRGGEKD